MILRLDHLTDAINFCSLCLMFQYLVNIHSVFNFLKVRLLSIT